MFLEKNELKTVATMQLIDSLTAKDDDIVNDIIDESICLIKGYLSRYYDVERIFDKQGNDRHKYVLKILKDIVIYEIYERHTREQNAVAKRRYDEALNWLKKNNTGELFDNTLIIQIVNPDNENEQNSLNQDYEARFGGNKQHQSRY
jgi:hypothetical protein